VPAPRSLLVASAVAGLTALLAAAPATVTAPLLTSPNGPSLDSAFRLEAAPDLSRDSAAALAAAPAGTDPAAFDFAAMQAAQRMPIASSNLRWKQVGTGGGLIEDANKGALVDGRLRDTGIVLSIAADPRDATASTVYSGSGGGLWKTTDGGKTWRQMDIPSVPVGGVGVSPTDPDLVVAATGQAFQGGGEGGGLGVYVSRDAGKTWTRPTSNVQGNGGQQVSISPTGAIFVATDRGLYRSTDNGASFTDVALPTNAEGTAPYTGSAVASWTSDVKVRPGHPDDVYAAVGYVAGKIKTPDGRIAAPGNGLYRSTRGGAAGTWKRVDVTGPTGWEQNPTESSDPIGRIRLAFAPDGNGLYALVADAGNRSGRSVADQAIPLGLGHDTSLNGLYYSTTFAAEGSTPTWFLKADSETLTAGPGSAQPILSGASALGYQPGIQAWYNGWVAVDPVTPGRVFIGEEETYVSMADATLPGPTPFKVIDRYISPCALANNAACPDGTPLYGGLSTHPDQHAGLPLKAGSVTRLWSGNDGGIFRQDSHATDDQSGFDNEHWFSGAFYNTLLPYRAVKGDDGSVIAGLQDNGTVKYYPGERDAIVICGGDGTGVAIDPDNASVFYCQANGSLTVTTNGGKSTSDAGAPAAPAFLPAAFAMDPTNAKHLVIGDTAVYETTKGQGSGSSDWVSVFTNPDSKAMTAVDTYGASVYESFCALCSSSVKAAITATDRGIATSVKPGCDPKSGTASCWHVASLKGMPARQIQALAIDPAKNSNLYIATGIPSVVRVDFGGVDAARVLLSTDGGETVRDVSGNLPRGNTWDIKVAGKRVYVATDLGVFTAPLGGKTWSRLGSGLPIVRTFGLSISADRTELVAATYGAGVWTIPLAGGKAALPPPATASGPKSSGAGTGTGHLAATGPSEAMAGLSLLLLAAAALTSRRRRLGPKI
jgi:photosystem II stability/assembly factor-like uncharacterized protein